MRVDGMHGVPPGGVRDVGTLPDRCSWLEDEHLKLNDGGGEWISIHRMRKERWLDSNTEERIKGEWNQ